MSHIHAEEMKQYAQDAAETDRPWERWEWKTSNGDWVGAYHHPRWDPENEYRRKPQTRTGNVAGRRLTLDTVTGEIQIDSPGDNHCAIRRVERAPDHYPPNLFYDLCKEIIDRQNPKPASGRPYFRSILAEKARVAKNYFFRNNCVEPDRLLVGSKLAAEAQVSDGYRLLDMEIVVCDRINDYQVTAARRGP